MKYDLSHVDFAKGIGQIKDSFLILLSTPTFIIENKLWKGFLDHKWVLIFSIAIAGLFSYIFCKDVYIYFTEPRGLVTPVDIPTDGLDDGIALLEEGQKLIPEEGLAGMDTAKEALKDTKEKLTKEHKPLFSGSLKFLLLVLLEVVIFHFSVKTNNILKNESKVLIFKDFFKAQKRMILVMGRKWLYGLLMYILISIICGLIGTDFLKDAVMFLIYGFYLGFAFLDNYLEQHGFKIRHSAKCIQSHFGASALFGVIASLLLSVPLLGPLVVPLLFGIAATRYGHESKMETFEITKRKINIT